MKDPSTRFKARNRPWAVVLLGSALLAAGAAMALGWDVLRGSSELETQLVAAKREGLPLTVAELQGSAVAEAENADGPYLQALALCDAVPEAEAKTLLASTTSLPVSPAAIRSLGYFTATLEALRRGAQLPHFQAPPPSIDQPASGMEKIRRIAKALQVSALSKFQNGDRDGAFDDLTTLARFSTHLRSWPCGAGYYWAYLIERQAHLAFAAILAKHGDNAWIRKRIRQVAARLGPLEMDRNVKGDLVALREFMRKAEFDPLRVAGAPSSSGKNRDWFEQLDADTAGGFTFRSVRDANEACAIRAWRRVVPALPRTLADVPHTLDAIDEAFNEVGPSRLGNQFFEPLWTQPPVRCYEILATERLVLQAALDLVDGKTAEVTDPRWKRPLIRRSNGRVLTVYSVGANGKDDGGDVKNNLGSPFGDDIYISLPLSGLRFDSGVVSDVATSPPKTHPSSPPAH